MCRKCIVSVILMLVVALVSGPARAQLLGHWRLDEGTGTTTAAAMAAGRNSIGLEIDDSLESRLDAFTPPMIDRLNACIEARLSRYVRFLETRIAEGKSLRHRNKPYGFPVVTAQEKELLFNDPITADEIDTDVLEVTYANGPQKAFCRDWAAALEMDDIHTVIEKMSDAVIGKRFHQKQLF